MVTRSLEVSLPVSFDVQVDEEGVPREEDGVPVCCNVEGAARWCFSL